MGSFLYHVSLRRCHFTHTQCAVSSRAMGPRTKPLKLSLGGAGVAWGRRWVEDAEYMGEVWPWNNSQYRRQHQTDLAISFQHPENAKMEKLND